MLRCAHCAYSCCAGCAKRFFAESPLAPASCMNPDCRKRLSEPNLLEAFSEAYVHTGMERARREALVRQDDAYVLPTQLHVFPRVHTYEAAATAFHEAQAAAEREERALAALAKQLYEVRAARALRTPGETDAARRKEEQELYKQWKATKRSANVAVKRFLAAKDTMQEAYNRVVYGPLQAAGAGAPVAVAGEAAAAPQQERIFRCSTDGCNGNWRASDGACLVCRQQHCARCSVPVAAGTPHACAPADVASLRAITLSTRACPRCHAGITRHSGCAQMMCVLCHCIFNWDTGAEERGVIHNPHFHNLSADARQRVLDERASRGIVATREQRFVAGVGAGAPACNPNAQFDPECEPLESAAFREALPRALPTAAAAALVVELYRQVLHHREDEAPRLRRQIESETRHLERSSRLARVEMLRGAALVPPAHVKNGHPEGLRCLAWLLPRVLPAPNPKARAAGLMRLDTTRTKLACQLEVSATFAEAGEGLLRLLLAATPAERPAIMDGLQQLHAETERLMREHKGGKAAKQKRRREQQQRAGKKRRTRGAAAGGDDEDDDDDDDEDEEEASASGDDDDDDGEPF